MAWWKPSLSRLANIPQAAGIGALIAGGLVALPMVMSSIRSSRRFDEDNVPMPKDLSDPLPQVLEAPPMMAIPPMQPPMQQPETMMGMAPVKGDFVRQLEMRRGGLNAGVDPAAPSLMGPDGRNVVDGTGKIEDLNLPPTRGM